MEKKGRNEFSLLILDIILSCVPKFDRFFCFIKVFENQDKMVLVMEYAAGGELYEYLNERNVLTEEEARRIFRQISTAIYYCHKVCFSYFKV